MMLVRVPRTTMKGDYHTWNDHEDAVGNDQDLDGTETAPAREDAAMPDQMDDQLAVEENAIPEDGGGFQDGPCIVVGEVCPEGLDHGLDPHDAAGNAEYDDTERDEARNRGQRPFPPPREQIHHGPRLDTEHDLYEDSHDDGEDLGDDALHLFAVGDQAVFVGPERIKVVPAAGVEDGEEDLTYRVENQGRQLDPLRELDKLELWDHGHHDDHHHDGSPDLRAVVDTAAIVRHEHPANIGHVDRDLRLAIRTEQIECLLPGVEVRHDDAFLLRVSSMRCRGKLRSGVWMRKLWTRATEWWSRLGLYASGCTESSRVPGMSAWRLHEMYPVIRRPKQGDGL